MIYLVKVWNWDDECENIGIFDSEEKARDCAMNCDNLSSKCPIELGTIIIQVWDLNQPFKFDEIYRYQL